MSEPQLQFVVGSFLDENAASGVLRTLLKGKQSGTLGVVEAAVIRKEDDGRIDIKETGEIGAAAGAAAGGLLGSIVGVLRSAPIAGAGLGALLGGAAAQAYDSGIPNARLQQIAGTLPNGSSAVVTVVDPRALVEVRTLLESAGGGVTAEPIVLARPDFDVPDTGNKTIDDWAEKAADSIAGYAGQAEKFISGLADRAQGSLQDVTGKRESRPAPDDDVPPTPPTPTVS